jgi:four helix bundle suffix protein
MKRKKIDNMDGFIDPHGGFRNLKSSDQFLLEQQLRQLEKQFIEQGGFTEKLYHTRLRARRRY